MSDDKRRLLHPPPAGALQDMIPVKTQSVLSATCLCTAFTTCDPSNSSWGIRAFLCSHLQFPVPASSLSSSSGFPAPSRFLPIKLSNPPHPPPSPRPSHYTYTTLSKPFLLFLFSELVQFWGLSFFAVLFVCPFSLPLDQAAVAACVHLQPPFQLPSLLPVCQSFHTFDYGSDNPNFSHEATASAQHSNQSTLRYSLSAAARQTLSSPTASGLTSFTNSAFNKTHFAPDFSHPCRWSLAFCENTFANSRLYVCRLVFGGSTSLAIDSKAIIDRRGVDWAC